MATAPIRGSPGSRHRCGTKPGTHPRIGGSAHPHGARPPRHATPVKWRPLSFVKVLKHVRRSVIRQCAQTSVQIKQVMATMAAKVCRKLDNGVRRLREADRSLKRPASNYSFRKAGQIRRPTRRVAAKVLTLHPAIVQ